ncbi:MAG: RtcB family protein [Calditrichia bacterium]
MLIHNLEILPVSDYLWEVPPQGGMRVPGRIFASRKMLESSLKTDESLKQVVNVAHLPGIQKYSLAMPDIHWGYGFPIGGVAATDWEEGVISPGGVGYDINCGVRLAATTLRESEIRPRLPQLLQELFNKVPTGVGSSGAIKKLNRKEIRKILEKGAAWAIEQGFGDERDLEFTEEHGCMSAADPDAVSHRAIERGLDQAGTLGSGNHFLEVDVVEEVFDERAAAAFGLFKGQIVVQIHTGSRGLGYQVCDDYLKILVKASDRYGIHLPDRQLACAPIQSKEGKDYFGAMAAAANFAWNNRQIIMHLAQQAFLSVLGADTDTGFRLIYDVCHNIAKKEVHEIEGKPRTVCVHRKGATRAFPEGHADVPGAYRAIGQPVLVPGDMGRYSYVTVGKTSSMWETFGSSCHGAGRLQSRKQALKRGKGQNLVADLKSMGVLVQAKGMRTLAEEIPYAYKDVSEVVEVMEMAGIAAKVARLRPIGVIKG